MKKSSIFILIVVVSILTGHFFVGCSPDNNRATIVSLDKCDLSFFGDSVAVFIGNELQNGYRVSIIHNSQLALIHFERGDSISQYCAIHKLPSYLEKYEEDSIGVYYVNLEIPVLELDTIDGSENIPDMFYMDMNFDGEEEFVVAHEGYNRTYYACFDLVNGNYMSSCPGLLESIREEPYNNIVSGIIEQPSYTAFDRKNKEIYIYETVGCCAIYETWAKLIEGNDYGNEAKVRIVKRKVYEWGADGKEHIATYKLVDETLKLVEKKIIDF